MADKADKSNKLKPRLPRGLADRSPGEIAATRQMIEKIRAVYELYGFEPVETPAIEYTDALGKFLPDQDRPNEGVFSFQDDDEQWLSLRYDLTAPLARYVAENFDTLPKPYRSYRVGTVFRNEKPGPGRFREFMQFDADTVGSSSPAADAELCMMAADTMEALGIPRGSYVVKISNRKILDGVLEDVGLSGEKNSDKRLKVMRAIDKLDRLGREGVRQLLGEGRTDQSGDRTPGARLDPGSIQKLIVWLDFENFFKKSQIGQVGFGIPNPYYSPPKSWPENHTRMRPGIVHLNRTGRMRSESENWDRLGALAIPLYGIPEILIEGFAELEFITDIIEQAGYGDRIRIDPSVVRGLEYYTGPVFEVELTFSTDSRDGSPRFGSVGGGGRYDGLISRFRGEPVPATGFSIGVSRLLAALEYLGKIEMKASPGPVVVVVFSDRDPKIAHQNLITAQEMARALRKAGIRAEAYLGNPKNIPNQFKYADRRNSPCMVIQGSDEKARGDVIIRDMILGAELSNLEKDRVEYLARLSEAQMHVPEGGLVRAVRDVLARHGLR
jgi:histidyl-tRNA synthetase